MQKSPVIDQYCTRRSGAFTLTELMVSMVALSVLVLVLTTACDAASRAWKHGEGNTERGRTSRCLTDFIASELQGAVVPLEAGALTTRGNLQFIVNPKNS